MPFSEKGDIFLPYMVNTIPQLTYSDCFPSECLSTNLCGLWTTETNWHLAEAATKTIPSTSPLSLSHKRESVKAFRESLGWVPRQNVAWGLGTEGWPILTLYDCRASAVTLLCIQCTNSPFNFVCEKLRISAQNLPVTMQTAWTAAAEENTTLSHP